MDNPSMSTDTFRQAANNLAAAGIPYKALLPIAPIHGIAVRTSEALAGNMGKAPGFFIERQGKWTGLKGDYITKGLTEDLWEDAADWPTENVGVLCRFVPAIDSDAESPAARKLVERVIDDIFGAEAIIAERLRGKSDRRLYAFRARSPNDPERVVRGRKIKYRLPGDDTVHGVDILGHGNQFVAVGTHPSGSEYRWAKGNSLCDKRTVTDLLRVENSDIEQFYAALRKAIEKAGGEIVSSHEASNGDERYSVEDLDAVMPVDTVLDCLDKLPNTIENFPTRDDILGMLAAIKGALGAESYQPDTIDAIREWATEDESVCDDAYFFKMWDSLDKVSVSRDLLSRIFLRNNIKDHVKDAFDGKAQEHNRDIKERKKEAKSDREAALDEVANRYVFEMSNASDGMNDYLMRSAWDISRSWSARAWWKRKLPESEPALIMELQEFEQYSANDEGCANFLRDLKNRHPDAFFLGETKHPAYDRGEVVVETQPDGHKERKINRRYLSEAIRAARKDDKHPKRSKADLAHVLDFIERLFGKEAAKYELDTLAYMAQTTLRPGALLFMVGDSGVGKSLYSDILTTLFDGTSAEQMGSIDGTKLHNESSRRFILARAEGCRILNVKELPEGSGARDMANVTATLKQIVDAGPAGDWLMIERKRENERPVRNFARVIVSSNYANSIYIEAQDRRTFYVQVKITLENKPDADYYDELVTIKSDPERLACFWRYLMARDVSEFQPTKAPASSMEKSERVIAEIQNPITRHMQAALYWLKNAGRSTFTARELMELMTDCALAEYQTSGGNVDDRTTYKMADEKGKGNPLLMSALRTIPKRDFIKLPRDFRTSKERYPAIYITPGDRDTYNELMSLDRDSALGLVEDEYERGMPEHPMSMFRLTDD